MNSPQFMVFSIDQQLQCIEQFDEGLMFISTNQKIILYDLCTSNIVASCNHIMQKPKNNQNVNKNQTKPNHQNEELDQKQNKQQLTAIELHFFYEHEIQNYQHFCSQKRQQTNNKLNIGYLLVHYKLKGLAVYNICQIFDKQKENKFQQFNKENSFKIQFNSFTPFMFGSAFLKLSFDDVYYQKLGKSEENQQSQKRIFQQILRQGKYTNKNQIQSKLKDLRRFDTFQLKTKLSQTRQFFILTNQNQIYEVKRLRIYEGKLQTLETFQLDEQTAELSLTTVTAIKVINYLTGTENLSQQNKELNATRRQRQLSLGMQGGILYFYDLPSIKQTQMSNNTEHYIEPVSTLFLQQFLKSNLQNKQQDLQYSILGIEMISDGLGLVLVRKCGILLIDFKTPKIISRLQKNSVITESTSKTEKAKNSRNTVFNECRILKLVNSNLQVEKEKQIVKNFSNRKQNQKKIETQICQGKQLHQEIVISNSLVLCTNNRLLQLGFTLRVKKVFDQSLNYQQKIEISHIKSQILEIINTSLIESLKINHNLVSENNRQLQLYGHVKQDKIFTYFN